MLKAKFAEIDTDGSGELDASELSTLFESLGKAVSVRLGAIVGVGSYSIKSDTRLTGTPLAGGSLYCVRLTKHRWGR